jgi:hypothetical protein
MTWPSIVLWLLIFVGAIRRGPMLLYVFGAAGAFGSLQMVPGDMVHGVNLLPQSVCAVFLVGKILLSKGQIRRALNAALDPAKLGLLFLFLAYGLLSAYAMPRLFAHSVEVIPVSASAPWPVALEPTVANITQPAYLALSSGIALAFTLAGGRTNFQRYYLLALLFAGIVSIVTGLMDLVSWTAGLADLLEPFRNASYALLIDVGAFGGKRVVGLMPEASAYGPACVGAAASLAFLRPFFPQWLARPHRASNHRRPRCYGGAFNIFGRLCRPCSVWSDLRVELVSASPGSLSRTRMGGRGHNCRDPSISFRVYAGASAARSGFRKG